ncbi:ATP-grasp domain-containing protein [Rhizobium sp. MHM7A]|uniref:ATP-grasp domain-containing protein n=1 Tax=Rhizobium sp. MHM7A TaxID=2583233 RepID=UPI0011070E20|nr:ATP-grasp domain-containing protein [Rhizobium sp. MHM7A]TLX16043.1 hypothetical protein FFR93_01615 [Rhizobium sp. MHM7A]
MTKWEQLSKEGLMAIAESVREGNAYVPPYQGRYFTARPQQFGPPPHRAEPWTFEGNIQNLPTDDKIAEVLAFDPRAAELMAFWREVIDRSFPGWSDGSVFNDFENETSGTDRAMRLLQDDLERHELTPRRDYLNFEIFLNRMTPDPRDHRLHAIDDAETIRSLTHLNAGEAVIFLGAHRLTYDGQDKDGLPRLSMALSEFGQKKRSRESSNPYWTWHFFQKYMLRRSVTVSGDSDLLWTLCDMASQGFRKAFLKNCVSKGGTWTIDLEGVRFLRDAAMRVRSVVYPHNLAMKAMVQEHLPFTHEQRFFVVNGRVVASVCSDRNFSTLDQIPGKRLDHRLAALATPEIEHGAFDRGVTSHVTDRKMAARFARLARKIANDARGHGILDYVVDIGLTSKGPAAIEVNELELSGPYSLNRDWVAKAYARRQRSKPSSDVAAAA